MPNRSEWTVVWIRAETRDALKRFCEGQSFILQRKVDQIVREFLERQHKPEGKEKYAK